MTSRSPWPMARLTVSPGSHCWILGVVLVVRRPSTRRRERDPTPRRAGRCRSRRRSRTCARTSGASRPCPCRTGSRSRRSTMSQESLIALHERLGAVTGVVPAVLLPLLAHADPRALAVVGRARRGESGLRPASPVIALNVDAAGYWAMIARLVSGNSDSLLVSGFQFFSEIPPRNSFGSYVGQARHRDDLAGLDVDGDRRAGLRLGELVLVRVLACACASACLGDLLHLAVDGQHDVAARRPDRCPGSPGAAGPRASTSMQLAAAIALQHLLELDFSAPALPTMSPYW